MDPVEQATWRTAAVYLRALLTQYGPMPATALRRAAKECDQMADRQGDPTCRVLETLADAEKAVLM